MNVRRFLGVLGGMASCVRYSQSRLAAPESVLEHTGFVALTCLAMGRTINERRSENVIDIGVLLEKALVHDMDEVITGDVSRPTKYSSQEMKGLLEKLSETAMDQIDDDCDTDFKRLWGKSKSDHDGSIVAFADCLSVLYKAHEEIVMRGNKMIVFGDLNRLAPMLNGTLSCIENNYGLEFSGERVQILTMIDEISEALK